MAKASKTNVDPNWHPNFRIVEELPDIKPVRTDFLVNSAMVVLMLAILGVTAFTEVRIAELSQTVAANEAAVGKNNKANTSALANMKKFGELKAKATDVSRFANSRYDLPAILESIIRSLPEEIYFRRINISHYTLMTKGKKPKFDGRGASITFDSVLVGKSVDDLSKIDEFREQLRLLPELKDVVESISTPKPSSIGVFEFQFSVQIVLKKRS